MFTKHLLNINTNINTNVGRLKEQRKKLYHLKKAKKKLKKRKKKKADSAILIHCNINIADVTCQL